jgi:pimeloyl-ACP methyl ester carboxylesterase
VSLSFERAGTGPVLVLIHGLGHRRQAWDAVLSLLTPHRDVITLDLPGHGGSPPLGKHESKHDDNAAVAMADEVAAFLAGLGVHKPHVAGNSLGGSIALILGAQGEAASVTALSPAGFPNHGYQVVFDRYFFGFARMSAITLRPVIPALTNTTFGRALLFGMVVAHPSKLTPEQARGDLAGIAAAGAAMHAVFGTFQQFTATIPAEVPVTIAWGTKDRILAPANATIARRRLPAAKFLSLPGCGHVPMTDDPELVARVLLDGSASESN